MKLRGSTKFKIFRILLSQCVHEKVENMLWNIDFELSKFLDELLESNDSTLSLITPNKCLFKWIEMLELNLECSKTLLYLELLLFCKLVIADQFDMLCILLVPIDVNGVRCA